MTADGSLLDLTIAELSRLLESRAISPSELVDASLAAIDTQNPVLHAFTQVDTVRAKRRAHAAEREIRRGARRSPIHGVPIGVKDQIDVAGMATSCGSTIRANFMPNVDAGAIARLRRAGAIIVGKQNMSQFAMGDAFVFPYGTPRNPWSLDHRPGSSSSGSAAAVAARLCSGSIAEDTGGSIRGPAAYTGVTGLRPSWGRVSRSGVFGQSWSMDTLGPLAKSAEDCALLLSAIAGRDPRDATSASARVPEFAAQLRLGLAGMRIGVISDQLQSEVMVTDPDVEQQVGAAVEVLVSLGANTHQVRIPFLRSAALASLIVAMVEGTPAHRENMDEHWSAMDPNVRTWLLAGSLLPAQIHYAAQCIRERLREGILGILQDVDAIVLPTSSITAPLIDNTLGTPSKGAARAKFTGGRNFFAPANLAGVPALSVPCGFTREGLPVGLQIIGRRFDEQTVLDVGHAYQQVTNWHTQRPAPAASRVLA